MNIRISATSFPFIIAVLLAGCTGSSATGAAPSTGGLVPVKSAPSDSSTPITVSLSLSKAPRLNEQAELTFVINANADAPATTAEIILPEGTTLISGDLEWSGALPAHGSHTMTAVIMFVTEGNKTIDGKALYPLEGGDVWGDAAHLYLHTTAESGQVGFPAEPTRPSSGVKETSP
jgi:hypothetical protein